MLTPGPGPSNVPSYCHGHDPAGGRFYLLDNTPAGLLIHSSSGPLHHRLGAWFRYG
jgi:hypothetical protein